MRILIAISKEAANCCVLGAGVTSIIINVISAFVDVSLLANFVTTGGVGLVCAAIGGYHKLKRLQQEDNRKHEATQTAPTPAEIKRELAAIRTTLENQHQNQPRDNISIQLGNRVPSPKPELSPVSGKIQVRIEHVHKKDHAGRRSPALFPPQTGIVIENDRLPPINDPVFNSHQSGGHTQKTNMKVKH